MKDQGKIEQKDTEFYEDEDLHQHVEHYENLILEKNNEIKGFPIIIPRKRDFAGFYIFFVGYN